MKILYNLCDVSSDLTVRWETWVGREPLFFKKYFCIPIFLS